MARQLSNVKSVQAQLDELRELKLRVKILEDEMKQYMADNDLDHLNGITTCYNRTWVNDSVTFDTEKFKKEHADLYTAYKTKAKAGYYRFNEGVIKN
jgi:predicted phage-related endonuclease